MAYALPRILVGLLFLIAGIMKLTMMGPEVFSGIINSNFGTSGSFGLLLSWLVIIAEIGGGAVVLAGKLAPRKLYKFSIRILIIITLAAAFFVQWGNINNVFKDLIIVAVLFQICNTRIICPMGITGEKTKKH